MIRIPMATATAMGIEFGSVPLKMKPMKSAVTRLATNKKSAIETVNGRFGCDESDNMALGGA